MTDLTDEFQKMALSTFVAYKALSINETPVACILVESSSKKVLSIGYNDTNRSLNGTRHGEFIAVDSLLENHPGDSDITVYVTVEPCIMCASALKQISRIKTVVFGCGNDRFGGNGTVLRIQEDSYESYPGVLRLEAIQLLRNFYIQENDSAPDPKIKKNKDLENKEYPPMNILGYLDEDKFIRYYGKERLDHRQDEITPVHGRGYNVRELITLEDVLSLPGLDEMYKRESEIVSGREYLERVERDLEDYYTLFYPINELGKVDWNYKIKVYQEIVEAASSSSSSNVKEDEYIDESESKKRKLL